MHLARHRLVAAVICGVLVLPLAACSGDDGTEAAYCDAWAGVVSAFEGFRDIDVVNGGLDSVRSAVDGLRTSADELREAGEAQLGEEVSAFTTSLQDLVTTLTSPDLPVDRRTEVRAARADVDAAWNDLVAAARADCASVDVPSA